MTDRDLQLPALTATHEEQLTEPIDMATELSFLAL